MPTLISDLWTPAVWVPALEERQARFPVILNSNAVNKSPTWNEFASGAGTTVNIPFFKDITDQADEVQVENTAPVNDLTVTAGVMVSPMLNRVTKHGISALSEAVSGGEAVEYAINKAVPTRSKQKQTTLISILRGNFGTGTGHAISVAAPLSGARIVAADESGVGATALQTMSADQFINGKTLLGELANDLMNGAFFVHPDVLGSLEKADASSFKSGVQSGLPFTIRTYREVPIFACEALKRVGTTDGFVYDSYIMSSGVIAYGEKPQSLNLNELDVASLHMDIDWEKNNALIYDRTRALIHINGTKWVGTPAAQSASNTELAVIANWNLVYTTASRCGIVCIQTNG